MFKCNNFFFSEKIFCCQHSSVQRRDTAESAVGEFKDMISVNGSVESNGSMQSPGRNDTQTIGATLTEGSPDESMPNSVHATPQDASADKKRAKHKCPFPDCNSVVVHLPRHMRCVHGWSNEKSKAALNLFNSRKQKSAPGKKSRMFKRKIRPMKNCNGGG